MLHSFYHIYLTVLFISIGSTDKSDNIFELDDTGFSDDALNAPSSFNSRTFHVTEIENQPPDDTALLFANEQIGSASPFDVASMAGWNVGDGPAPTQGDNSIDRWDSIAPASNLLDLTADSPSDPSTSAGLVDTGYLTATSPIDYLADPLKYLHIPLPDVMSIWQEKCPPIREGEILVPLCCTGGRMGQTVTDCQAYDITNWNCYLPLYQFCCKLFIAESHVGVSCLKGFR